MSHEIETMVSTQTEWHRLGNVIAAGDDQYSVERMLELLQSGPPGSPGQWSAQHNQTLLTLVRLYSGERTYFINYYGPPATVRTISRPATSNSTKIHGWAAIGVHQPGITSTSAAARAP